MRSESAVSPKTPRYGSGGSSFSFNTEAGKDHMNKSTHTLVGGLVGGVAYLALSPRLERQPSLGGLVFSVAAGAAVACLHDVLEPALHPNHRGVVHGLALNTGLAVVLRKLWEDERLRPELKVLCTALGLAFLSHPALDATTPKGIPFLS